MKAGWLSVRLALIVSGAIASISFAAAQVQPGSGAFVVLAMSSLWVTYSVSRQRRFSRRA